jgi:hypothetical protein
MKKSWWEEAKEKRNPRIDAGIKWNDAHKALYPAPQ